MPQHEEELGRDPAFYAQDIICAVRDMSERFSRAEFLRAIEEALAPEGLEIIDLKAMRHAA